LDSGKSQDYLAHAVGGTPAAEVEDTAESLVIQADRVLNRAYKYILEEYGDEGN
jgi:hypothetical protein